MVKCTKYIKDRDKNTFLVAKKFALDDNQTTISIEHIKCSLNFLETTHERARVLIKDIDEVENHTKITFNNEAQSDLSVTTQISYYSAIEFDV